MQQLPANKSTAAQHGFGRLAGGSAPGSAPPKPPDAPLRARSIAGQALWARMYNSFAYLTDSNGYGGHRFPIVFGETGTFLTSVRPQP